MLRALEKDPHPLRLQTLERRFRREERFMQSLLRQLQTELDHREQQSPDDNDLLIERDELTEELDHIRTAIHGARQERRRHLDNDPDDVRLIGA